MSKKLFGTDGIRGVAGEYPLDRSTAFAAGAALGEWARRHGHPGAHVLLGMDTRESGPWLARTVAAGLASAGAAARFAGIITTPGVAYLTKNGDFVAGVMISASHNPYHDNGIKVFDHSGFKLPDEQEREIENAMLAMLAAGVEPRELPLVPEEELDEQYLAYLMATAGTRLEGLRLSVDCGNGAASQLGPELFRRLGAHVQPSFCSPNGRNINAGCGALHLDELRDAVVREASTAGVAFDGDADRALFVSGSGKVIDGDSVLLLAGRELHRQGRLTGSIVVATVMSNIGLERAFAELGIKMLRAPVGDKYVLEQMEELGAVLGGEQSGHVIFREYATTGDGLLTALRVFEILQRSGQTLDDLTADLVVYPQKLVNVRVRERRPLSDLVTVRTEIQAAQDEFGPAGRVLVRFSGTEPLARVMVEGPDEARVYVLAHRIASAIQAEIGA